MHQTCFLVWEQREAFITLFNQVTASSVFGRVKIHHMEPDGSITTRSVMPDTGARSVID
jgi:hypothetical protein